MKARRLGHLMSWVIPDGEDCTLQVVYAVDLGLSPSTEGLLLDWPNRVAIIVLNGADPAKPAPSDGEGQ